MTEPRLDADWQPLEPALVEAANKFIADLFADAPPRPAVPTVNLQAIVDELARLDANRPCMLVPSADVERVRGAIESANYPIGRVEASDLVPEGRAYLINTQAINEATERREPWPGNAAVRWTQ